MKKIKKVVSMVFVVGVFTLSFCARAETFEATEELCQSIRSSIMASRAVRSGGMADKAVTDVCELRIKQLESLLRSATRPGVTPAALVSNYAGACRLSRGNLEIVLLYRSISIPDLIKNSKTLIGIYKKMRPKSSAPASSVPAEPRRTKKWSGPRPNRQNGTHNGRSYHN